MKISYPILLFLDFRYVVYCLDQKQQIYSYMIIFCWWFCVVIFTAMVMGCNFHGHGYNEANFRVISYTCVKAATKNENQIDYHQNTVLNLVTKFQTQRLI